MNGSEKERKLAEILSNQELWEEKYVPETEDDEEEERDYVLEEISALELHDEEIRLAKDVGNNTIAHLAAMWDHPLVLDLAVRKGVDLNSLNKNGKTALDLAMHWCHYDISVQIQHFGGKHSYERERDVAIAQRDLAQGRIDEAVYKMEQAIKDSISMKEKQECMRLERDRAMKNQNELIAERDAAKQKCEFALKKEVQAKKDKEEIVLRNKCLEEELRLAIISKENAVQGWQLAQKHAIEMEKLKNEALEREKSALLMRDQALIERDASREIASSSQQDHAIAVVHQKRAEAERDRAIQQRYDAEQNIKQKIEQWAALVANAQQERNDVHKTIHKHTSILEAKIANLVDEIEENTVEKKKMKEIIESLEIKLNQTLSAQDAAQLQNESLTRKANRLQSDMKRIIEARKKEKSEWDEKEKRGLHEETRDCLTGILTESMKVWRKLKDFRMKMESIKNSTTKSPPYITTAGSILHGIHSSDFDMRFEAFPLSTVPHASDINSSMEANSALPHKNTDIREIHNSTGGVITSPIKHNKNVSLSPISKSTFNQMCQAGNASPLRSSEAIIQGSNYSMGYRSKLEPLQREDEDCSSLKYPPSAECTLPPNTEDETECGDPSDELCLIEFWTGWCNRALGVSTRWNKNFLDLAVKNLRNQFKVVVERLELYESRMNSERSKSRQRQEMQQRIIDRKDALIKRFNHHKHEQNKSYDPFSPMSRTGLSKFRECLVQLDNH